MRRPRGCLLCALLAVSLAVPRPALAGPKEDLIAARTAFSEGASFAAQKSWSAACDRYALSLKLHPAALTLYSLGVAQREAGRLVAARESFRSFLSEPVTPSTQAFTGPARSAVEELRARVASLTLVLSPSPPPGAVVTIDGVVIPRGSAADPRAVDPGAHEIVAIAPGRVETRAHVTLPEGGSATLTLVLRASPGPVASGPVASAVPLAGPVARREPWPTALPFALLGGGGAALGGGIALGLAGLAGARKAVSAQGPAASEARALGIAGDVVASVGVAAAGVGLVLLIVQRARPAAAEPPRARVSGGAGLFVTF